MTVDGSVQLLDSLRAVRQRWRMIAFVVAVSTGLALALSLFADKQYDATAQLLLRGEEPINSILDPSGSSRSSDPERDLNTEVELIKIGPAAQVVQRQLGLKRGTDRLLDQIETDTSPTSSIVRLRARYRDPVLAALIANAFAEAYVDFRVTSARERYRQAADLARRQLLALSPVDRRSLQGRDLEARQRELEIASALQTGGAELVRRASIPTSASRPRPLLSGALGALLGLVLGLGAALVLSLVDRRLREEHEVEEFFGLPVLAAIPRPARRGAKLDDPAQFEAYGLLAANLRLSGPGRSSSVVMITSPGPGDGKTSVVLGVARAYARLGLSVVAIEADVRRPAFARYADVSGSRGLTGVLAGGAVARELIWLDPATLRQVDVDVWLDPATLRPVDVDGGEGGAIGLLSVGAQPDNPPRMLSDPGMSAVVDAARTLADVVIVDTAPVGTVNDATMLVPLVDGVVVVARLNQTTKDAARRAKRTLGNLGADMLGVVVTDAGVRESHAYYTAGPAAGAPPAGRSRSGVQGGVD